MPAMPASRPQFGQGDSAPQGPPASRPEAGSDAAADLDLVERIRRSEPAAWSTLVSRYQHRLFSVCLRMVHSRELAADLTQDAFVKIIQGMDTFDGRSKLSTWMIRITMNVCLSKLRSEKLRRHASLDAIQEGASKAGGAPGRPRGFEQTKEPGVGERVEHDEERAVVLAALRELDPEQRAVLILCDSQGQSYDQIAEVMQVAVGTIKSRLFRARTALREAVEAKLAGRSQREED